MKKELRDKILNYNRERMADREKADELMTLINALPAGQVKNLLKDDTCRYIIEKYGITGK